MSFIGGTAVRIDCGTLKLQLPDNPADLTHIDREII